MVSGYHMDGFSGYGVQFSPFYDNRIAVATGANYGLVGNGKLFVLEVDQQGKINELNSFLTQDCLFDTAWSEIHEDHVLVAQGDGCLRLFDSKLSKHPIAIFREHQREVFSCNWNMVNKQMFVSSSWDGLVKIWTSTRKDSLVTLQAPTVDLSAQVSSVGRNVTGKTQSGIAPNKNCIYQAQFSPHNENLVVCCSGNSYVTFFDIRQKHNNRMNFLAHSGLETLTCDFNKYRTHVVATSGVDKSIRIWDIRMLVAQQPSVLTRQASTQVCINEIPNAHELAIRKLSWSPFHSNILMSTSYDMTCGVWRDLSHDGKASTMKTNSIDSKAGLINRFHGHTEFVFGGDWCLWGKPGNVVTTGWDSKVLLWDVFQG